MMEEPDLHKMDGEEEPVEVKKGPTFFQLLG